MQITWLGHGTFEFRLPSGQVILMDPWTDGNPSYPKGHTMDRVDTICITHGHFDHIHDAVPLAQRFAPEVVGIYETCAWLESKGVKNTRPMNKGGSQKVGDVTVTMTHAVHSCGILDDGKILYGGEAAGYVFMDFVTARYEKVYPMVPAGAAIHEMIFGEEKKKEEKKLRAVK